MVTYPADTVDINGKVWKTIGENIRYGAKMQGGQPEPVPEPETDYHGLKITRASFYKTGSSIVSSNSNYTVDYATDRIVGYEKTIGILGWLPVGLAPLPAWYSLGFFTGTVGLSVSRLFNQFTEFTVLVYFIEKE